MEDVLDLYHEDHDPSPVQWCVSTETSKQLIEDTRSPIEAGPARVQRYDYEYKRNGTRNLFMFCEPKGGCETCRSDRASHCCGLRSPDALADW